MNVVGDPALISAEEILCQTPRMTIAIARSKARIAQALALRARIFREEFALPQTPSCVDAQRKPAELLPDTSGLSKSPAPMRDEDLFDPWCAHLVAIETSSDRVVGTYRILTPEAARQLGCRYTEQEFWLTRLDPIRDAIVELGRACVDPAFRGGATLMLMWSGLARWLAGQPYTHLMGCVSLSLADGGSLAKALYEQLMPSYDAGECFRVWPIHRLRPGIAPAPGQAELPPLLRAYLRAGARIMGEPCVDQELHCVDFPVLLPLERLDLRFRQRFAALAA